MRQSLKVISTGIIGLIFSSCAPYVNAVSYKKSQDVPGGAETTERSEATCDTLPGFWEKHTYLGIGFGPETGLSLILPKVSYYNFQDRKILSTYYGIEGTIGIIERPWLALDCLYGVKKSIFTFDTSAGVWWLPGDKRNDGYYVGSHFHATINPKIGFKFWKVWLKAGPSVHLYRDYPKGKEPVGMTNLGKIGNMYYNFEVLFSAW